MQHELYSTPMFNTLVQELHVLYAALSETLAGGFVIPFILAICAALAFEFINGFHDTANAVATVIYTRSMRPTRAVVWSGFINFLGVLLGGTAVAMGIVKLLPLDLVVTQDTHASLIMVFSMLGSAILWNFGTWYLGLPASSSHTLIGAILGIGMAHAVESGRSFADGVNWAKAMDIGLALLISPLIGFGVAALLLLASRKLLNDPIFHTPASPDRKPPFRVRATLIATCTGVSFAHGSNDGQKGIGLIMLILIGIAPAQFALRSDLSGQEIAALAASAQKVETLLAQNLLP